MMKKILMTVLIASMLILPANGAAPAADAETDSPALEYLPGDVPAETGAVESMTPALHGMVLALLNRDETGFDTQDSALVWEGLYNTLSLYGQLDDRSGVENDRLCFPEETLRDYAAVLSVRPELLDVFPADMADRVGYDNISRCWVLVPGTDSLAHIQVDSLQGARLTGSLVYDVDGQVLARFTATLQPQDNMFGYAVTSLSLAG